MLADRSPSTIMEGGGRYLWVPEGSWVSVHQAGSGYPNWWYLSEEGWSTSKPKAQTQQWRTKPPQTHYSQSYYSRTSGSSGGSYKGRQKGQKGGHKTGQHEEMEEVRVEPLYVDEEDDADDYPEWVKYGVMPPPPAPKAMPTEQPAAMAKPRVVKPRFPSTLLAPVEPFNAPPKAKAKASSGPKKVPEEPSDESFHPERADGEGSPGYMSQSDKEDEKTKTTEDLAKVDEKTMGLTEENENTKDPTELEKAKDLTENEKTKDPTKQNEKTKDLTKQNEKTNKTKEKSKEKVKKSKEVDKETEKKKEKGEPIMRPVTPEKREPGVASASGSKDARSSMAKQQKEKDDAKKRKMDELNNKLTSAADRAREEAKKKLKNEQEMKDKVHAAELTKLQMEQRELEKKLKRCQKKIEDVKKGDERDASPTLSGHSSQSVPAPTMPRGG
eukprot:s3370_g2.t1